MVERNDRAVVATLYSSATPARGATVTLDEDAAHHARVRRLAEGPGGSSPDRAMRFALDVGPVAAEVTVDVGLEDLVIAVLAIGIVGFLAGNQIQSKLEQQIEDELMAYAGIVDLYPMKEIESRAEEIARIARIA